MMKSTSLGDRWKQFASIVFDPWVILLLVASASAGVFAAQQSDPKSIALMTFIAATRAGVLGGVLAKRWNDITEERVIVARGKTAVRGLKLLLSNIAHLEKRARIFLSRREAEKDASPDETTIAFEEIVGRCRVIEEEALSSIENWTDIVPEADVKTQIGVITELHQERENVVTDLVRLKDELAESANKSLTEVAALRKEIQERVSQLRATQRKLTESQVSFGGPLSGSVFGISLTPAGSADSALSSIIRTCGSCKKIYLESETLLNSGITSKSGPSDWCNDCRVATHG